MDYEEEVKIKAQRARKLARYMSSTEDLVENAILKAQAKGAFEGLKGAGQPIDLSENPFEPPELRMVFKILKNNDFAPFWIETGKQIDEEKKQLRLKIHRFKQYVSIFFSGPHSQSAQKRFEKKKEEFYYQCQLQLEKIERLITNYNLHCPTFRLGRANLNPDEQMENIINHVEGYINLLKDSK
jgi:DnaJ family protein C protein 28